MGDSGKPFACTEIGCNQRFVNEDHLEVHRRKHEMSLGLRDLKSLDTPVIADQTPTPTRFLKNCEEVGLFNEPPNPFDALFRKASVFRGSDASDASTPKPDADPPLDISDQVVEIDPETSMEQVIEETSQQAVSSTTGDEAQQQQQQQQQLQEAVVLGDDLTGQVIEVSTVASVKLPNIHQAPVSVVRSLPVMGQNSGIMQAVQLNRNTIPISGPILLRLPSGQTIPVVPPSVSNPEVPIPVAISAVPHVSVVIEEGTESTQLDSKSVKQKLKNSLLTNQSQGNMGVMTQAVDVVTRQQVMANQTHMELKHVPTQSPPDGQIKRRRRNSDMSADEKRERFLERNRAAATRCRNKRKSWVQNLEQKADDLNSTNNKLMSEVTKLREEVAQLKQLLLAHNDCPVTIMQRQTHVDITKVPSGSGDAPGSELEIEEVKLLSR